MSGRGRMVVLAVGLLGVAALYVAGTHAIPGFGHYRGPYGDVINAHGVDERHVTDMVTAINFDVRGLDTLGEEFILFVSATAVAVVLRRAASEHAREQEPDEQEDEADPRRAPPTSPAVQLLCLVMVAPTVLVGIDIAAHGQLTPGGGFQGGIILATALLLVYLSGGYRRMRRIGPVTLVELGEAAGAGGFVAVGIAALICCGAAFLTDVLPLGTTGSLVSGGTITVISVLIGVEVAGSVMLIATEFLEQALEIRGPERQR